MQRYKGFFFFLLINYLLTIMYHIYYVTCNMITATKIAAKKKPKQRKAWRTQTQVFSCKLRSIREHLGLTMREVAGCGVDIASIARAEQGFEVTLTHALILAKFFEKPIEEIWSQSI